RGGGRELGMHGRDTEHEEHAPRGGGQRKEPATRGGKLRHAEDAPLAVEPMRAAVEEQEGDLAVVEATGEGIPVDARRADARLELAEGLARGAEEEPPPGL